MSFLSTNYVTSLWEVFLLFAVPVGGGIPAGVLLAKARGVDWVTMTALYFVSDLLLAILFEPMMILYMWAVQRSNFLAKFHESLKKTTSRTIAGFGATPGPFLLVIIAFGIDPMTGRAAAMAAGHNFIAGWAIAIAGDMLFFSVVAISTLCLNNILGDGTWTAIIIMGAMMGIPALVRRIRNIKN